MTEAEALDMAARAAGWEDWQDAHRLAQPCETEAIRAHAATLMENAALKAENERLREALIDIVEHCANLGYGNPVVNERIVDRCDETARAALKEIEGD